MLTALWSGLGGEVAKHWMARILTPAFAFWVGGLLLAWTHRHAAAAHRSGWTSQLEATARWVQGLPGAIQIGLVLAGLALVTLSALAADRVTLPVLRLLEGHWSRPLWLWKLMAAHRQRRQHDAREIHSALSWRTIAGRLTREEYAKWRRLSKATALDQSQLAELDELGADRALTLAEELAFDRARRLLWRSPEDESRPTRLGDMLRAAERRPLHKYGLDGVRCWHALNAVLPTEVRTELVQARTALDQATRTWLWGVLFVLWAPWTPWAVPIAVTVCAAVYYVSILSAAALLGDLIGTAYDLYRFRLYDALAFPRPTGPADELKRLGPQVNHQLGYGIHQPAFAYVKTAGAEGAA